MSTGTTTAAKKTRISRPLLMLSAAVVLLTLGMAWYQYVWDSPSHVFWSMVNNSLDVKGIVRKTTQAYGTQVTHETTVVTLGASPISQTHVTFSSNAKTGGVHIAYQLVGTEHADYYRYTSIKTSASMPKSAHTVVNVWGKAKGNPGDNLKGAMIGVVPFAHLSSQNRQHVIAKLQSSKAYGSSLAAAQLGHVHHTATYTYTVHINEKTYAPALEYFASLAHLGKLTNADIPPCLGQSLVVNMVVAVKSRQLMSVTYPGIHCVQTYSQYTGTQSWTAPKKTIPLAQLEQRLQILRQNR